MRVGERRVLDARLGPTNRRLTNVLGPQVRRILGVDRDLADLLIVVAPIEQLEVRLYSVFEQAALHSERECPDVLGSIDLVVVGIEEAAGLESGLVAHITQGAVGDIVLHRGPPGRAREPRRLVWLDSKPLGTNSSGGIEGYRRRRVGRDIDRRSEHADRERPRIRTLRDGNRETQLLEGQVRPAE